jgi:hypothetical protein
MELVINSTESSESFLKDLVSKTKQSKAELITQAFQLGIRQLWEKHILDDYLLGKVSRTQAINSLGVEIVELAEHQQKAMMEDLEWGLNP